jgi:CxxC-x17-CxxC domain-containing protein
MAMYEGNWKCSNCGGAITQLPFQPRSESGLTCRTCYAKIKEKEATQQPVPEMPTAKEAPPLDDAPDYDESQIATEPMPADDAFAGIENAAPVGIEKKMNEGNWNCSMCGGTISSLPFEPRRTDNLKCLDCYKASKG